MMYTIMLEDKSVYTLEPLNEEEVDEARLLCDSCVGDNLYSDEEISTTIDASNKFFYLLKSEEGKTVGYIYYYLTELEPISWYAKIDVDVLRSVYSEQNKLVCKIQSVGLKESHRSIGLAEQMVKFVLQHLRTLSIDIAYIVCWKPGGILPLGKTLTACKFDFLIEAKRIWYDDSELICPYCKGRCSCDAEIYYKLIERIDEQ